VNDHSESGYSRSNLGPGLSPNMSEKLDFTLLPTARDVIRVNDEIRTVEQNLKDALADPECSATTITGLERELEVMKAWIAPIRRLNTDILSIVFEMCGEDNWKTPLRVAATSRDWRNLVLVTPRAWEFLRAKGCDDIRAIKLYLERSDQRPLHLYPSYNHAGPLLSSISQRLECLTLDHFHYNMTKLSFPKLKRLVITEESTIEISCIDTTRFPALRHVICADYVELSIDGDLVNFPPLQSLAFAFDNHQPCWLRVLQACQDTLISLDLGSGQYRKTISKPQLVFSRLICLATGHSGAWTLNLKTPVLETYMEYTGDGMRPDTETVTQLRTNRVPESLAFPKVKLIQIIGDEPSRDLLNDLLSNPAHFSELETIEVPHCLQEPSYMVKLMETVNGQREQAISLVFNKFRDLRCEIRTQLVRFAS
jgi:hypothetical protein